MSFVKTLIDQNEKIMKLENRNEYLENENSQYKHENRNLKERKLFYHIWKNKKRTRMPTKHASSKNINI